MKRAFDSHWNAAPRKSCGSALSARVTTMSASISAGWQLSDSYVYSSKKERGSDFAVHGPRSAVRISLSGAQER
jgi:hypothetical protein